MKSEPGGALPASVVLVHGGFLGPWSWSDVASLLEEHGISVHIPDLPSIGDPDQTPLGDFYADAAIVRRVLDGLGPPVLLCGHSYGGAVISEAAGGPHPAVAHLVYLTAAVPDVGQSMASLSPADDAATSPAGRDLDNVVGEGPVIGPAGSIMLESEPANAGLFHDCSKERARDAVTLLRPMNPAVSTQPLTRAAWRDLPSTFVRGSQDRMPEIVTAAFFDRNPEIITLPTGHCPNWSRPDLVADLIVRRVVQLTLL